MPRFASPAEAQAFFYSALSAYDADSMMQLWDTDSQIVCIHPGAPRLDDYRSIADSWQQILANANQLLFRLLDEQEIEHGDTAIFTARVEIQLDGEVIDSLLNTNVFRRSEDSWRLVLHHSSPDPAFDEQDEINYGEAPEQLVLH